MNALPLRLLIILFFFGLTSLAFSERLSPVKQVQPVYPQILFDLGIEGEAVVKVSVAPNGRVREVSLVSASQRAFGDAALNAAKDWRFESFNKKEADSKSVQIPFQFRFPYYSVLNEELGREIFAPLDLSRSLVNLENILEEYRPQPKRRALPKYPKKLLGSGKKGNVVVSYVVDEEGDVRNPVVINNANPDFVMPALLAAIHTEWRPLQSAGGEIVYQKVTETYQFYEGMEDEKQTPVAASNTEAKADQKPQKEKKRGWNWFGKKKKDVGETEEE